MFELGFKGGLANGDCASVKKKCNNVIHGIIEELEKRFPSQKIMNATSIIYF